MNNEDNKYNLLYDLELGEGQYLEFKETLDRSLAKEIVAFANASGGIIYIGISDVGAVKGITISNRLKSEIQDIARNCDPPIAVLLTQIENVLAIDVAEGVNKPYSCSAGFFIRMGANSQKMNRDEILTLAIKTGKIRFDEQICSDFDWRDFDEEKFDYYLKLANISKNLQNDEILRNLRVLTKDGMTNAGVLYFAKHPHQYLMSAKIRCIHFRDDNRIDILDKKEIDRGIIGNIEFAVSYLKERIPVRFEIKDLKRKEFPEYPNEAYREAIVNAVIHFDYFLGDAIAIEKLKSSIVINNKGELLFPKSEFGKRSESRNRLLVDLLARTNFMEKAGTGIKRVNDACIKNGNKCTFHFSDAFWITIESNELVPKFVNRVTDSFTDYVAETASYNVTDNITDNSESDLDVTDNVTDDSESDLDVTDNVADDTESDLDVTVNVTDNSESDLDVTDNVADDTESDLDVTDNSRYNRHIQILNLIEENNAISTSEIANHLGVVRRTIARDIETLKSQKLLKRVGPDKGGYWEIIK